MLKKIAEITIETRLRQNMGDLKGLMESLKAYGQIQPIVLDEDDTLIAGGRRLTAAQMLGWNEIEVVYLRDLDIHTKRMIELEENIRREPLSEYEKSERLTQLLEAAKEVLKAKESDVDLEFDLHKEMEEVSMTPRVIDKNSILRGPKAKPDSMENVAALTGIPRQTFTEAKQHMEIVREMPALKDQPKKSVIQAGRELQKIDDPEKRDAYKKALTDHPDIVQLSTKPEHVLELNESREQIELRSNRVKSILDVMGAVRRMKVASEEDLESLLAAYLETDSSRIVAPAVIEQWHHISYVFEELAKKLDRRFHSKLEVVKK